MGGSYGGYATLVGLTFTPDIFACGVDIVGPSSLLTLLNNSPQYWMRFMGRRDESPRRRPDDRRRKKFLAPSPLSLVEKINKPLSDRPGCKRPASQAAPRPIRSSRR